MARGSCTKWSAIPLRTLDEWREQVDDLALVEVDPTDPDRELKKHARARAGVDHQLLVLALESFERLLTYTAGYYLWWGRQPQDKDILTVAEEHWLNVSKSIRNVRWLMAKLFCSEEEADEMSKGQPRIDEMVTKWRLSCLNAAKIPAECGVIVEALTALPGEESASMLIQAAENAEARFGELHKELEQVDEGWNDLCRQIKLVKESSLASKEIDTALSQVSSKIQEVLTRAQIPALAAPAEVIKKANALSSHLAREAQRVNVGADRPAPALPEPAEARELLYRRVPYIPEVAARAARAARPYGVPTDLPRREKFGNQNPVPIELQNPTNLQGKGLKPPYFKRDEGALPGKPSEGAKGLKSILKNAGDEPNPPSKIDVSIKSMQDETGKSIASVSEENTPSTASMVSTIFAALLKEGVRLLYEYVQDKPATHDVSKGDLEAKVPHKVVRQKRKRAAKPKRPPEPERPEVVQHESDHSSRSRRSRRSAKVEASNLSANDRIMQLADIIREADDTEAIDQTKPETAATVADVVTTPMTPQSGAVGQSGFPPTPPDTPQGTPVIAPTAVSGLPLGDSTALTPPGTPRVAFDLGQSVPDLPPLHRVDSMAPLAGSIEAPKLLDDDDTHSEAGDVDTKSLDADDNASVMDDGVPVAGSVKSYGSYGSLASTNSVGTTA